MKSDKVFGQADALWHPQSERIHGEFGNEWATHTSVFAKNGGLQGSAFTLQSIRVVDRELTRRAELIVKAAVDAHEVVGFRRTRMWSSETVGEWSARHVAAEAENLGKYWPSNPHTFWGENRSTFSSGLDGVARREVEHVRGLITQHFGIKSKNWMQIHMEHIKGIPNGMWGWVAAALTTLWALWGTDISAFLSWLWPRF